MIEVFEVFEEFMQDYTFTRNAITNTYAGQVLVPTTSTISAYIHPNDPAKEVYNKQGTRVEESVKIFAYQNANIAIDDEVSYDGKKYKVFSISVKQVGSYIKALAELMA